MSRRIKAIMDKKVSRTGVKRVISGLLVLAVVLTMIPVSGIVFSDDNSAEAAVWDSETGFTIPQQISGADVGTVDNPFVVLEIVPNESMASFGYLVGGQEPVDIQKVKGDGKDDELGAYIRDWNSEQRVMDTEFKSILDKWLKEGKDENGAAFTQEDYNSYTEQYTENNTHYGTYKYVGAGKGNYLLEEKKEDINGYEWVGWNKGDYALSSDSYKLAGDDFVGQTQYFVVDGEPTLGKWEGVGDRTSTGSDFFYRYYNQTFINSGMYEIKGLKNNYSYYSKTDNNNITVSIQVGKITGNESYDPDIKNEEAYKRYNVNFKAVDVSSETFKNDRIKVKGISRNYKYYVINGEPMYTNVGDNKGSYKRKKAYTYTLSYVGEGKGNYVFEGLSYDANSGLSDSDKLSYTWTTSKKVESVSKKDYVGNNLKGYIQNDPIMNKLASSEKYENTELFKKYGIGLAYKDNDISKGEDVDTYKFMGWYYDKYGVNKFDESKRLTKNTNIYAKWKTIYPAGEVKTYTVSFNKNCTDNVYNMSPEDDANGILVQGITDIEEGSQIVAPNIIPKRAGYNFAGWYTDADCTTLFDYNTKINSNITLYAGWKESIKDSSGNIKEYIIRFDANTGNPDEEIAVPDSISGYRTNGMYGDLTIPTSEDGFVPVRSGYTFAGWYYNRSCTKLFTFGDELPSNVTANTITLYAKWVDSTTTPYTLNFIMNEPSIAIKKAEFKDDKGNTLDIQNITAGIAGDIELGVVPALNPELDGNITAKLNKYYIKVITVTPDDLNDVNDTKKHKEINSHNRELIDRANMIVINQTTNEGLSKLWADDLRFRNTTLFCKDSKSYNSDKKSFDEIDLDWVATERIWKKVSVGNDGKGKNVAPLLFDYNVYKNASRTSSYSGVTRKYSDNTTIPLSSNKASNNNVFKLYLLTQQMNPVTLYKAYLAYPGGDESKKVNWSDCYINKAGSFVNTAGKTENKWDEKILAPYEAILFSDYSTDAGKKASLDALGYDIDPSITKSVVHYRSLVFYSNLLGEFVNHKKLLADNDMLEYMEGKKIAGEGTDSNIYSMTDGVYYLLNSKMTTTNITRDLNVLEIEPSDKSEAYKSAQYWYWYIAKYITNFSGNISVDAQSVYEFVGKNNDLNADYDVVFIGANTSGLSANDFINRTMPVNSNGSRYRYAHTGNDSSLEAQCRGTLGDYGTANGGTDAITTAIYPGNDITKVKMKELLTFAGTGYPIVFGRDMIRNNSLTNLSEISVNSIDTGKIDTASYVYKLMKTLISEKDANGNKIYDGAYFFENQINSKSQNKKFSEALTVKKFSISLTAPIEYKDTTLDANSGLSQSQVYINGANPADVNLKKLKYTLKINTQANNKYIVKLYVDTNADGKYVEEEKLDSLEIFDKSTGKYVRYNKLVRSHEYTIERTIDDYAGAIPWKLEVTDATNTGVRCAKTGMCAIIPEETKTLNILQIDTTGFTGSIQTYNSNMKLPTTAEINEAKLAHGGSDISFGTKNNFFNNTAAFQNISNSSSIKTKASQFYYYMKNVGEFDFHITRLNVDEFVEKVRDYPNYFKENDEGIEFNMLILGFSDCYSDITDKDSLDLINKFINEGNTVLFTHDTTSFVNSPRNAFSGNDWWGYNINQYFRGILGMDRYDVKNNAGEVEKVSDKTAKDWAFKAGKDQKKDSGNLVMNSNKVLNQGFTPTVMMSNAYQYKSTNAQKINNGQLVSYPYTIPDNLQIATTHQQYYQLDLEDNDTVVWYTLNFTNSNYKDKFVKKDARNSYYIYNKGNITYTGVGHSPNITEDEVKLFVNTMVSSYKATVRATEPVITNADKSTDNKDTDYLYVDYDATVSDGTATPFGEGVGTNNVDKISGGADDYVTKRTYFTLKNNSIVLNKRMSVHYFPVVVEPDGTEVVLDGHIDSETNERVPKIELPLTTCRYDFDDPERVGETLQRNETVEVDGKSLTGTPVESGEYYYVDVPIQDKYFNTITYRDKNGNTKTFAALDNENKFKIQIQVVMRYGKDLTSNEPLVGKRNVVYMKRGNFILD